MPRVADFSNLSDADLRTAVRDLVARGRVTADEVRGAAERARRITELEAELTRLKGTGRASRGRSRKAQPATNPTRKITNSPALKAARVMQGRYMGRLRKLAPRERRRVKAVAKKQSVAAAVKFADKLLAR